MYTKTIDTNLDDTSTIDIIAYVDNLLKPGTSINCEVAWKSNSALVIGRKISSARARYIYMPRTNNNIYTLTKDSTGTFVMNQVSIV